MRHPKIIILTLFILTSSYAEEQHNDNVESEYIGTLIYVPSGKFQRDSNELNISYVDDFLISKYEISREQFKKITNLSDPSNDSTSSGYIDNPVQQITWYQAIYFSNKLSQLEGLTPVYSINNITNPDQWGEIPTSENKEWNSIHVNWNANGYRLPTEMEWLWAAMGGDKIDKDKINKNGYRKVFSGENNYNSKDDYAWCRENSDRKTHIMGSKKPNALGIYDMTGNVWEWNWDWYGNYPNGYLDNYKGPSTGNERLLHGGSWLNGDDRCNNNFRLGHNPDFVYGNIGIRLVRKI